MKGAIKKITIGALVVPLVLLAVVGAVVIATAGLLADELAGIG